MFTASARVLPMFDSVLLKPALAESLKRLSPRAQWRNPVMFVVWIGSALTTLLGFAALHDPRLPAPAFTATNAAVTRRVPKRSISVPTWIDRNTGSSDRAPTSMPISVALMPTDPP